MRTIKQSTAYTLMAFMTDATDHIAGKAGLTLTITASKAGAAFASISPTVTERGDGWYAVALTSSHTDTLGDLALHITASGADPTDVAMQVRARITDDLPTGTESADALLKRDWTAVTGEASRSALNALRVLRNAWTITAGEWTVTKENDSTPAFAKPVTPAPGADPISEVGADQ